MEYIEYPYRFVIVLIYTLSSVCIGFCWNIFSSIQVTITKVYDVPDSYVTFMTLSYVVVYLIFNFPTNWILDVKGLRVAMLIAGVFTVIGTGLKCLINYSYYYAMVGQIFCGIAQPFVLNAVGKLATYWFKQEHRPMTTSYLALTNSLATLIAFVLPSAFVNEYAPFDLIRHQVFNLLLSQFIPSGIVLLLIVFLFKEKPQTPPSLGAETKKSDFKASFKVLAEDRNFLLLLLGYSMVIGTNNYFGSFMNFLLKPYGYSDNEIGLLGALTVLIGFPSSFLFSWYIQKTNRYKLIFIICCLLSLLGMLFLGFELQYFNGFALTTLFICINSFGNTPLLPLSIDFGCEIMFPVGQALIAGILQTGGMIMSILLIVVIQNGLGLQNRQKCLIANMMVVGLLFVCLVSYCLVKQNLKRKQQQRLHKSESLLSE